MFAFNTNENVFAAVASIGVSITLSAVLFATAIIPATPGIIA